MMRAWLAPIERLASTNARVRNVSTWPRTMRAIVSHDTAPSPAKRKSSGAAAASWGPRGPGSLPNQSRARRFSVVSKTITRLTFEVQNGAEAGGVSVATGAASRTIAMKPAEIARFTLEMPAGVPYHRDDNPTSYLYVVSFHTTAGFVPFLDAPPSGDSRYLGAHVRLVPEYADAETTTWSNATDRN